MSFQTSGDILNIVLSIVVALVGLGLLWLIVELIRIVRPVRKLVETVEDRLTRIDAAVHTIRDRVLSLAGLLPAIVEWLKGMGGTSTSKKRRR